MLNNFKIGTRLNLGFGLLLALLCVMAGLSAWQMRRLADISTIYAVNLVPSFDVETKVALGLGNLRRFEFRHILAKTDVERDDIEARMAGFRKTIAENLDLYTKTLVSDDEDRRELERVRAGVTAHYAAWEKLQPVSRAAGNDPAKRAEAAELIKGASAQSYEALQVGMNSWVAYNIKQSQDQQKIAEGTYDSAKVGLLVMLLAAVGLGAASAAGISRAITRPIQQAVAVAEKVAAGDLSVQIDSRGRDETAQLLQALDRMTRSLADIVGQVRLSSDSIATGSAQIAAGNADLSQRTEEQASNLEQTAASMEQLSSTVKASSATAGQANTLAAAASAAATQGGQLVGNVVGTMQEIAASSRKIADIIGVIDGIAFQTNILALNAAVEAARAGEQGRGFAVVASEVRSLAGRSADAAKEIKSLIHASAARVEAGARQVNDAGAAMQVIVAQVTQVSQLINTITHAAQEQSLGIGQVGDAVNQLDQVTQQNAALVEQSAASAESLKQQATQLAGVVAQFRLGDGLAAQR